MKLDISLFKFDYKSDYLPYYTKHYLDVDENNTLLFILNKINEDFPLSFENTQNSFLVVNETYMSIMTRAKELKSIFGRDIKIEPLSIRRACNDLIINEEDFDKKFEILKSFIPNEKLEEYKKTYNDYKIYFYASNTLNFEREYIGDAFLLLSYDLINEFPNKEKEVLDLIKSLDFGIEYHTSLQNRVLNFDLEIEKKINELKDKVNINKEFKIQKSIDFPKVNKEINIQYDFKDFTLAYFKGLKPCEHTVEFLDKLKAKKLNLRSLEEDLSKNTFHINSKLTYKIASKILLDAFDSGADFLVVDNEEDFEIFDTNRAELEKVSGRNITLPILHKNELINLAIGEHTLVKKSLEKHTSNPEII